MERPDSIRRVMQKDHEARTYINWLEKRIREVDKINHEIEFLKEANDLLEQRLEEHKTEVMEHIKECHTRANKPDKKP